MHERATAPQCLIEALVGKNDSSEATAKAEAKLLSLEQAMDTYLTWDGIIGFTDNVMEIIQAFIPPEILNGVACGYVAVNAEGDVVLRAGNYSPSRSIPVGPTIKARLAVNDPKDGTNDALPASLKSRIRSITEFAVDAARNCQEIEPEQFKARLTDLAKDARRR